MNKFDKVYNKIITECNNSLFNKRLYEGHKFAPESPFEITEENYVSGAMYKGSDVYGGCVEKILSNDEFILKITGRYSEQMIPKLCGNPDEYEMDGWSTFRGPATYVKYKLIPGESYYICDKVDPHCKWLKVLFKNSEINDDIETEDGECCGGDASGGAGITTNSVFGSGNTAGDSLIQDSPDHSEHSGITTHDMKAMYTLHLNPRYSKKYPVFKRKRPK